MLERALLNLFFLMEVMVNETLESTAIKRSSLRRGEVLKYIETNNLNAVMLKFLSDVFLDKFYLLFIFRSPKNFK